MKINKNKQYVDFNKELIIKIAESYNTPFRIYNIKKEAQFTLDNNGINIFIARILTEKGYVKLSPKYNGEIINFWTRIKENK